jgi:hypothetical protein
MGGRRRAVPALAQDLAAPELSRRLGCYTWHRRGPGYLAPALEGVGAHLPRAQLAMVRSQPQPQRCFIITGIFSGGGPAGPPFPSAPQAFPPCFWAGQGLVFLVRAECLPIMAG